MTRRDALALIRAMKENGHSSVSIDRLASGAVTIGVKVSGKDIRRASKTAQEVYDGLAKRYQGGK